jgi:hypothetical protein
MTPPPYFGDQCVDKSVKFAPAHKLKQFPILAQCKFPNGFKIYLPGAGPGKAPNGGLMAIIAICCCCMKAGLAAAGSRWGGAGAGLIMGPVAISGPPAIMPSGEMAGKGWWSGEGETGGIAGMTAGCCNDI